MPAAVRFCRAPYPSSIYYPHLLLLLLLQPICTTTLLPTVLSLLPQLVEGFTFLDHFSRTYPNMFIHKCRHCNGAGSVTCPHCQGYKLKQGTSPAAGLRLADFARPDGRLLLQQTGSAAEVIECKHCGGYCDWDHESEWEEK